MIKKQIKGSRTKTILLQAIMIIIVLLTVMGFFNYWQQSQKSKISVPSNFAECQLLQLSETKSILPPNECWWLASTENDYNECKSRNGIILPGGIQNCTLIFYNPDLFLPRTFNECVSQKYKTTENFWNGYELCYVDIVGFLSANQQETSEALQKCPTPTNNNICNFAVPKLTIKRDFLPSGLDNCLELGGNLISSRNLYGCKTTYIESLEKKLYDECAQKGGKIIPTYLGGIGNSNVCQYALT